MIYRNFEGLKLSALGLGTMRLPTRNGNSAEIDEELTARMVQLALDSGINYFDTAWMYHQGNSETVMGKILSRYPRDSYYLATKFPGFSEENMKKVGEIFETQLQKLQTDRVDFYLFHNVSEKNIDGYLDPQNGIMDYMLEQKKKGRIGHIGFSCHGQIPTLRRFLEAYRGILEFCQLQVNWFDWTYENAREKLEILKEFGVPLWVMEPVRGGKLIQLPEEVLEKLRALRPEETPAGWCFRFIQSVGATMTLSGMSDLSQLEANLATFAEDRPLNDTEMQTLLGLAEEMQKRNTAPCTACRYCTTVCPQELNIPTILELYNDHCFTGAGKIPEKAILRHTEEGKRPSDCIGCRACEGICPQNIRVADIMAAIAGK